MGRTSLPHHKASRPGQPKITHTEFQEQVLELAHAFSWRHLHVRRSIGKGRKWTTTTNLKGWPDLLLMRPDVGYVPAELKIPPDKATPEQEEMLAYFATMPATFPKLWTPNDWTDIQKTLAVRIPRTRESRSSLAAR